MGGVVFQGSKADQILNAPHTPGTLYTPRQTAASEADLNNKFSEIINRSDGPFAPTQCAPLCNDIPDTNDLFFAQLQLVSTGGAIADHLVMLPKPYRMFMLSSKASVAANNKLYFHLSPCGNGSTQLNGEYRYGGLDITSTGMETWFPMCGTTNQACPIIRFCKPITKFYLDVGFSAGGSGIQPLTILCANDLDMYETPGGAL